MSEPTEPCCSVCGHTDDLWGNSALLGCDAILCGYCSELWYDSNITDPEVLREASLKDRATGRREKMKAMFKL